jgi:hypothetical protein
MDMLLIASRAMKNVHAIVIDKLVNASVVIVAPLSLPQL